MNDPIAQAGSWRPALINPDRASEAYGMMKRLLLVCLHDQHENDYVALVNTVAFSKHLLL